MSSNYAQVKQDITQASIRSVILRILIITWLVNGLLLSGALLVGHWHVTPERFIKQMGFAACDLPCWAGLEIGVTPRLEVLGLLHYHVAKFEGLSTRLDNSLSLSFADDALLTGGIIYTDGPFVSRIALRGAMPIGYLLEQLGSPDCVQPHPQQPTVYWDVRGITIGTIATQAPILWLEDANATTQDLLVVAGQTCNGSGVEPWRGFAPLT